MSLEIRTHANAGQLSEHQLRILELVGDYASVANLTDG